MMKIGPSLAGVVGRVPGSAPVYPYSPAMKAYGRGGVVWNEETLFAYLEAPGKVVKGTKMSFPGLPDPQRRADVIAYLKQFSGPR
jgi:cytochrome c